MHERSVDVAIIGAGTAGLTARRSALASGAKSVVMIDGGPLGTTCARVGCMPSKLLIAAADAAHHIEAASTFGVVSAGHRVDGPAVMKRVQVERDRFAGFVQRSIAAMPEEEVLRGWARFESPTRLQVRRLDGGSVTIDAKTVVIAAGTEPWIPPEFRDCHDRVLTNESVFELPDLPESIAVLGTGVIGLELGQAMHRLGVRTRLFNLSTRVGPLRDPDMQALSRQIFEAKLNLSLGIRDLRAEPVAGGVQLSWTDEAGHAQRETFSHVLAATGRRPNLERLGLDALELPRDEKGYPRFDHRTMQIGETPLFLAGDFSLERSLLHEAADEGRIAGSNAARFPEVEAQTRRTPLGIVFTEPNVATVGTPIEDLDAKLHAFGEIDYSDQGRARVMAVNEGAVRIWGDLECGRLVAAEMIGPRAEHTAHLLAWAIQQGMTVDRALEMPFYHPVIEEGIRTALQSLSKALKHRGRKENCSPGV